MATTINSPAQTRDDGSGVGFLLGVVLLAIALFVFFVYGLPYMRQTTNAPQINIPGRFDINLNQGK